MHVFWLLKQPLLRAVEFKVYYPPPFQSLFLRGLDMELKSSNREVVLLFDQCLNVWLVQHRSLSLKPVRDVLCVAQSFLRILIQNM